MAYKYTTGSVKHGDIYAETTIDRDANTYIDCGNNKITLVTEGNNALQASGSYVGIGDIVQTSSFALDIPVSASTVRMGRLELGAWPHSTGYGFIGHSYQDHHGGNKHLSYNVLIGSAGDLSLNSVGGQDMYFRIGTSIKAAVDSNGFFGIGPNAGHASGFIPSSLLHVSSSGDEMLLQLDAATSGTILVVTGSRGGRVGIRTTGPISTFEVSGSFGYNYTETAGNLTVNETNNIVNYTGNGDATITLPAASKCLGRVYHILGNCQGGVDVLTVTGSGGDFKGANLEGDPASVDIEGNTAQSITVVSTGDNWFILTDNRSQGEG